MVAQPLLIIQDLKIELRRKLPIHAAFAGRLRFAAQPIVTDKRVANHRSVTIAIIIQLIYTNPALQSDDPAFELSSAQVAVQFVQSLSILTASTVFLKPFIDSLDSGFLNANRHDATRSSSRGLTSNSMKLSGRKNDRSSKLYAKISSHSEDIELQRPKAVKYKGLGYNATATPTVPRDYDVDSGSQILQTRTVTVEHQGSS
jgi:hypothetical protein